MQVTHLSNRCGAPQNESITVLFQLASEREQDTFVEHSKISRFRELWRLRKTLGSNTMLCFLTFLAFGFDLSDDFPVAVLAPMNVKLHGETGRLASTSLSVSEDESPPSRPSEDSPTLPLNRITPGS